MKDKYIENLNVFSPQQTPSSWLLVSSDFGSIIKYWLKRAQVSAVSDRIN